MIGILPSKMPETSAWHGSVQCSGHYNDDGSDFLGWDVFGDPFCTVMGSPLSHEHMLSIMLERSRAWETNLGLISTKLIFFFNVKPLFLFILLFNL